VEKRIRLSTRSSEERAHRRRFKKEKKQTPMRSEKRRKDWKTRKIGETKWYRGENNKRKGRRRQWGGGAGGGKTQEKLRPILRLGQEKTGNWIKKAAQTPRGGGGGEENSKKRALENETLLIEGEKGNNSSLADWKAEMDKGKRGTATALKGGKKGTVEEGWTFWPKRGGGHG